MFVETPRFPEGISYGAVGGPAYSTEVVQVNSGDESRNILWSLPLARYDVLHGVKTQAQMAILIAFFRNMKGRGHGFRFKDWADYQTSDGALTATGITDEWQMYVPYVTGSLTEYRKITKPVAGSVAIAGGGTYSVDTTTGKVTRSAGANPTGWTGQFDVPCRFDTDVMQVSLENYDAFTWGQIPLVELRL